MTKFPHTDERPSREVIAGATEYLRILEVELVDARQRQAEIEEMLATQPFSRFPGLRRAHAVNSRRIARMAAQADEIRAALAIFNVVPFPPSPRPRAA
jgi:hypothetical protein